MPPVQSTSTGRFVSPNASPVQTSVSPGGVGVTVDGADGVFSFSSYVKLDPRALADLLRSEDGPVTRMLMRKGDLVKDRAKQLVGVSKPDPVPRTKPRRPGNLRDHIVKRVVMKGGDVVVQVGADVPYALYHHQGTVPHGIDAKPGKWLVFYWPKVSAVVYAKHVNHPGTKANPFLVDALDVLR